MEAVVSCALSLCFHHLSLPRAVDPPDDVASSLLSHGTSGNQVQFIVLHSTPATTGFVNGRRRHHPWWQLFLMRQQANCRSTQSGCPAHLLGYCNLQRLMPNSFGSCQRWPQHGGNHHSGVPAFGQVARKTCTWSDGKTGGNPGVRNGGSASGTISESRSARTSHFLLQETECELA